MYIEIGKASSKHPAPDILDVNSLAASIASHPGLSHLSPQTALSCLVSHHFTTGSDYTSFLYKMGKVKSWGHLLKEPRFINTPQANLASWREVLCIDSGFSSASILQKASEACPQDRECERVPRELWPAFGAYLKAVTCSVLQDHRARFQGSSSMQTFLNQIGSADGDLPKIEKWVRFVRDQLPTNAGSLPSFGTLYKHWLRSIYAGK